MPALTFRTKLILAMSLTVAAVTGSTLYVTQQRVQAAYQRQFEVQFRLQLTFFSERRAQQLGEIAKRCQRVTKSVRITSALEEALMEDDPDLFYDNLDTEIAMLTAAADNPSITVIDPMGRALVPKKTRPYFLPQGTSDGRNSPLGRLVVRMSAGERRQQEIGYLTVADDKLSEFIVTPLINQATDDVLGALVMAFPLSDHGERAMHESSRQALLSGIWLDGHIHSQTIPAALHVLLAKRVAQELKLTPSGTSREMIHVAAMPHLLFHRVLNPGSLFPLAAQVGLYSMAEAVREQQQLRTRILGFGAAALLGGLALILYLSHGFSRPIEALAAGTRRIAAGDFEVRVPVRGRDELGALAASFNEMAVELAQKERYKLLLAQVSDPQVADALMHGRVALGGEVRHASVLFCDIRGFTALTEGMPPQEVIAMLNEHMTALTRVVHAHHGVVDKFVGDLIMAIFGAPKSYGDDTRLAVDCALEMLAVRRRMNETTKHRIEMGIGVATGEMVAGCMGSDDRLNYTVLGERVNLASRLCSKAGRAELFIDATTHAALHGAFKAEPVEPLPLKGFSQPVAAFRLSLAETTGPM
ncbi:MAG: adenylate/guanylate cyclase domain-containing protein [Prosthecobacter sp.]|uniref:adenylate/guanylate cyclase domain-containing protein n=1 Tax=Prosthecobacter sp. TaxID=1965333 RepID=UPI003900B70A